MQNYFSAPFEIFNTAASLMNRSMQIAPKAGQAALTQTRAAQYYWYGMLGYATAFMAPSVDALNAFTNVERTKLAEMSPAENLQDYSQLFDMNVELAGAAMAGSLKAMNNFFYGWLSRGFSAWLKSFENEDSLCEFASRLEEVLKLTVQGYPKAVKAIKSEYGFHLDEGGYIKVAETERFCLYQVLPNKKDAASRNKPILIVPPYVLGANILAFLPGEQRSYVHFYANQGVPTYIRLIKDIRTNVPVQTMTGEDDALDTQLFCRELAARHNRPVTLNGFCQGGYLTLAALLSGELDGLVDALITCVTPIDGTRSKSLTSYMNALPARFRDLKYSQKVLPDNNTVVSGPILSWVYKLRKLETESPIAAFHRDIEMFDSQTAPHPKIGKTAAAINQWLTFDQTDVPYNITKMSFDSYTVPIDKEGNLPVTLFGRKLNLKRIAEKKIPWLICIADGDDLVDKEAALAALDYLGSQVEVCVFPKGHAAIATSWSIPTSQCALHLHFHPPQTPALGYCETCRGPVCFQIDLDAAMEAKESPKPDELPKDTVEEPEPQIQPPTPLLLDQRPSKDDGDSPLEEGNVEIEVSPSPETKTVKAAKKTKTGRAEPKRRRSSEGKNKK